MTDLTRATLNEWLKNVTHKPGWKIDLAAIAGGEGQYVIIKATEPDTVTGGIFTTAPLFRISDEIATRAQFYDWLLDVCIPGIDTHERWEWFRVNGTKWRDPHAENMPAFATDFPG